jgi:hypothetical protein
LTEVDAQEQTRAARPRIVAVGMCGLNLEMRFIWISDGKRVGVPLGRKAAELDERPVVWQWGDWVSVEATKWKAEE